MKYLSTRGHASRPEFCDAVLAGLAPDGGLYLPEHYPQIDQTQLQRWRSLSYAELAFEILSRFATDLPAEALRAICHATYNAQTYCHVRPGEQAEDIAPLRWLETGRLGLLGLSNGPTLAFKDMAMQFLGNLFEYVLEQRGQRLNILGATSGDTGSAAEYAMRGKRGIRVFMLSPHGRMSAFQRAQMYSLQDENIFNIAVTGMFDDAQDIVKAVSADAAFKGRYQIGTVNSINWARIAAQIVYYFKAYLVATHHSQEPLAFCVPSGNFGNICAAHIARQMGLPIARLVLATNENNVLDEFFSTGCYRPRQTSETFVTSSPSMDISRASNFERFVFDLVGRDATVVRSLWQQIETDGAFDLSTTPYFSRLPDYGFVSGCSHHTDRLETIRALWQRYGVMVDPHTADGVKVALDNMGDGMPMIVLETAQAVKFSATLREALGQEPAPPLNLLGVESLPQCVKVMAPEVNAVKRYIAAHVGEPGG